MSKVLLVEQVRSSSKLTPGQEKTLRALGLRGRGSRVVRSDLRAIRGMLNSLQHLIRVEQLDKTEADARMTKKASTRGIKL